METYTLNEPPQAPAPNPNEPENAAPKSAFQKYKKIIIIVAIIFGFLLTFLVGLSISAPKKVPVAEEEVSEPTPTAVIVKTSPNPSDIPAEINTAIQYLPGKEYLDDSVAIITKAEPKKVLIVSASRFEQDKKYLQYSKVNYYTGTQWLRETITTTGSNGKILTNPLVSAWTVTPKKMLATRDFPTIQVTMSKKPITFSLEKMGYDISEKSLPGFTKFNYFGEGTLTIDDEKAPAYIVYTQSYSSNASDLSYLSRPEKLQSTWMAFWDIEGNIYYIDSFSSNDLTNPVGKTTYATIVSADSTVKRVDQATIGDKPDPSGTYSAQFQSSPSVQIQFALAGVLQKSTVKTYVWQTALTSGNVLVDKKVIPGVGLFETIH